MRGSEISRAWSLAVISGILAGFVVLGIGSRLAMRLAGAFAPFESQGALTEAQANVGVITFGGTLFLLFAGTFMGVPAALAYRGLFRYLPGQGAERGLFFGMVLLLTFGSRIIEPANPDFGLVGAPLLNVTTFALLFPLFGIALGFVHDRLERALPHAVGSRSATIIYGVAAAASLLPVFMGTVLTGFELTSEIPAWHAMALGLAALAGFGLALAQSKIPRQDPTKPTFWRTVYAPFVPACLVGTVLLAIGVAQISAAG